MRKIKEWFKRNKHAVALTLFSLVVIFVTVYNPVKNKMTQEKNTYEYKEKFDLYRVPAGMIVWKHGVPETYQPFVHADSASRYEFYDVGILTKDAKTIFCVRVPYYSIGLFQLGGFINIKNKSGGERNLRHNYYVQPYDKEKKSNNLTNL